MNDKSYRRNSTRRKRRLEVCCSFLPNLTFPLQYTIDYPRPRSKAGTSSSRTSRLMVPICCETNKLTKAGPFPWRCQPHTLPIPEPNPILSPCPDPPRVPAAPAPTRTRRCLTRTVSGANSLATAAGLPSARVDARAQDRRSPNACSFSQGRLSGCG